MGLFSFSIPEGEEALFIGKAHWSSYFATWLKVLFAVLVLVLILTLALPSWWDSRWGRLGIVIFALLVFAYMVFNFWNRYLTTYIVTQCRLIDITQEKFFRRNITEITLDEIEEVIIKQRSLWDKLFGKGDVIVKLKDNKGVLVYYDISKPEKVKEILDGILNEKSEIIEKEGEECSVILKDDKEHKVPLSYAYYGDKAKTKKNGSGLVIVKKKKEINVKKQK